MEPFCIVTDVKRCISCHACVAHCKTKNAMPEGVFLSQLVTTGPHLHEGKCVMHSEFQPCYHCEKAWCMDVCPSRAIQRDEQGAVWIDADTCIGCALCAKACPWNMPKILKISRQDDHAPKEHPQVDMADAPMASAPLAPRKPAKRLAVKCDHCRDLRLEGLEPACVTACSTHALTYMPRSQAPMAYQEHYAKLMATAAPKADAFVSSVLAKRLK